MDKKFFNGLAVGCIGTLLCTLGAVTIIQNSYVLNLKGLNKVNQVTDLIERKYYGEYSEDDIIDGLLQGSCYYLDDYSAYLSFEDYEVATDPDQKFVGIGVNTTFNKYTKVCKVVYCYDDAPAAKAGLRRNDIIEAIDGVDVYGLDQDMISDLIRGEPGTIVSLKINRDDELLDVDVVREHVDIPFSYAYSLTPDIGFIKITQFNGTVAEDFTDALDSVRDAKGIIIDLRDNIGGTVESYQDVMAQLLPSCTLQTLIYKDGRRSPIECESDLEQVSYQFVILTNNSTASCAEAMTQALVDLAGAKVVGVETFGKGVAQEYFQVDDNSVLRLTVGYVESPNGVCWNEVGIQPDVEVEYEYLGDDFQESVLMNDSQVRAGYDTLVDMLNGEIGSYVRPLSDE